MLRAPCCFSSKPFSTTLLKGRNILQNSHLFHVSHLLPIITTKEELPLPWASFWHQHIVHETNLSVPQWRDMVMKLKLGIMFIQKSHQLSSSCRFLKGLFSSYPNTPNISVNSLQGSQALQHCHIQSEPAQTMVERSLIYLRITVGHWHPGEDLDPHPSHPSLFLGRNMGRGQTVARLPPHG